MTCDSNFAVTFLVTFLSNECKGLQFESQYIAITNPSNAPLLQHFAGAGGERRRLASKRGGICSPVTPKLFYFLASS